MQGVQRTESVSGASFSRPSVHDQEGPAAQEAVGAGQKTTRHTDTNPQLRPSVPGAPGGGDSRKTGKVVRPVSPEPEGGRLNQYGGGRRAFTSDAVSDNKRKLQSTEAELERVGALLQETRQQIPQEQAYLDQSCQLLVPLVTELVGVNKAWKRIHLQLDQHKEERQENPEQLRLEAFSESRRTLERNLEAIKDEHKVLAEEIAQLGEDIGTREQLKSRLLRRAEELAEQQRILNQRVCALRTEYQVEQGALLSGKQSALLALAADLRASDCELATCPRGFWDFGRHAGRAKAVQENKQALQQYLESEVNAFWQLCAQMNVPSEALMIRMENDASLSLSHRAQALQECGFSQIKPLYRSFDGVNIQMTFQAEDERGNLLEGQSLLRQLRKKQQEQLDDAGVDFTDRVLLDVDAARKLKERAESAQQYNERLKDALLRKFVYPGMYRAVDTVSGIQKQCQMVMEQNAHDQAAMMPAFLETMESQMEALGELICHFGVERRFMVEAKSSLMNVRQGTGNIETLHNSVRALHHQIDNKKRQVLGVRLSQMEAQLEQCKKALKDGLQNQIVLAAEVNEYMALLQDQLSALQQLISGFSSDKHVGLAKLLGEFDQKLIRQVAAKRHLDQEVSCRERRGWGWCLRHPLLALRRSREQAALKSTLSRVHQEIHDLNSQAEPLAQLLQLPWQTRVVRIPDAGQPTLSDEVSQLLSGGVTNLIPIYRRQSDGVVTVDYEGQDESGSPWMSKT
ncbi:MAG: hypothetical protein OXC07_03545 [Kistimonas sp.]|nr:hypothetical protein [Kistimonas sp.]